MQTFKKLLFLLTSRERKHAVLLLLLMILTALLEMIGVVSILPFMAVLTKPSLIETNSILNNFFQFSSIFGIKDNHEFLFVLGFVVFVVLITSLTIKAFTLYFQLRFIQMREYSIGKRLIEGYLQQPYSWFLARHSAELGKNILSEVSQVIGNGMRPMMELVAKGLVAIILITLLVIVDPKLSLIVGFSLGGAYGLTFYFIRNYLTRIGEERLKNNHLRFRAVSEAFGAVKELKVGGLEQTYINSFSNSAQIYARNNSSSQVVAQLPRFFLEAFAFGGILLLILYLIAKSGNFDNALPIVSLYVFTGYRLLPALQQIYGSLTQLTFVGTALDKLVDEIKNLKQTNKNKDQGILSFNKSIILKNIHYNYPNTPQLALKDVSFNIPVKSTVGLVGVTGSGKTTTIDIILGLLEAQKGTLEVDEKVITSQNSRSWQSSIGYVPQQIYLSDDSVAANIAFGTGANNINQEAVEKVAKIANLHEFIIDELPKQYQTTIGERGVRLSGGQRQRIGIARALYHDPQLLILDEATSALDSQTEQVVMDAVNNLSKNITIILIAHRLNTVKNCDIIFKLEKGQLIGQGNYDQLINNKLKK